MIDNNRKSTVTFINAILGSALLFLAPTPLTALMNCNADCAFTSCSISCDVGGGGGAVCTCAWGFASCACGGVDTPTYQFAHVDLQSFDGAFPGTTDDGRPIVVTLVPSRDQRENLSQTQQLFRAFNSEAAGLAGESSGRIHEAILRGDVATYLQASDQYDRALQSFSDAQREVTQSFTDSLSQCKDDLLACRSCRACKVCR